MTLKILYTLEDGSNGSYLARSRKPHEVRVATMPNPSAPNDSDLKLRIGAINLSFVLDEIQLNSPEVMDVYSNCKNGDSIMDYNLYYHDICEVNEPLVSLGLLSKIRSKLEKFKNDKMSTIKEEHDEDEADIDDFEDDEMIIIGRVCSNFSAMLRRSYSNASKKKNKDNADTVTSTPETLEVKLKLKRVITNRPPERPEQSKNISNSTIKTQQYATPTMTNIPKPIRPTKRQTNPKPAPKAIRTQSLPIWDTRMNPAGSGFIKTSIAHKIYMADRQTETLSKQQRQDTHPDALTYEINSLQPDNSVQKIKVDDAISKRFDFMNKKKNTVSNPKNTAKKSSKKVTKATRTKSAKILPAMSTIHIPQAGSPSLHTVTAVNDTPTGKTPCDDDIMLANKENIPPISEHNTTRDMYANLLNFNDNNIDWLNEFNDVSKGLDLVGMMDPPTNSTVDTPIIINTNNPTHTTTKNTPRDIPTVEDMDRTSPIDTLSMPLIDLDQAGKPVIEKPTQHPTNKQRKRSVSGKQTKMTTCQDQLRRLPLLSGPQQQQQQQMQSAKHYMDLSGVIPSDMIIPNSDATVLVNYSPEEEENDDDDNDSKRHGIMPSSPGMMFGYNKNASTHMDVKIDNNSEDDDEEDGDDDDDEKQNDNDVFSSFGGNSNGMLDHDSPATNNCSSDPK
ncbi:hypothetical protein C6P45_004957 [Maudiozyma exigua]|uniref:Ams2/SPT21 N-terminal domain-containing protein n=1 Tax=Maudiozyma exigua TaxID=34358 RepID=A0A9P6WBY2_MAUEX|nr:hypothetical protein C6P45_004957 [Kazachstania exigua]